MIPSPTAVDVSLELAESLARHHLVYVHSGALHGDLLDAVIRSTGWHSKDAAEFLAGDVDSNNLPRIVFLAGVHKLTERSGTLGRLRATVDDMLDNGVHVCLVGRRSREGYPAVDGSSVVIDSKPYFLPPSPPPDFDSDRELRCTVVAAAFREVSVATLMEVERAIFEAGLSAEALVAGVNQLARAEMRSAGLFEKRPSEGRICVFHERAFETFPDALSDTISGLVTPPTDFGRIAGNLFSIERQIRTALRLQAFHQRGRRWKRGLLIKAIEDEVIARARADVFPLTAGIFELRDPLEWMTLGELIDVAIRNGSLNMSEQFWQTARRELVPIRNRTSHMRFPRAEDAAVSARWLHLIGQLGSRAGQDAIPTADETKPE